jgi:hypothetical protein
MCCLIAVAVLISPRIAILIWWLLDTARWASAFHTIWMWPLLGFLFLPWTTLVFVLVAPQGVIHGLGWLLLTLAVLADLSSYGGGYRSRQGVIVRDSRP